MIKKPLLAATIEDPKKLIFPLFGTPKLDGIRCIFQDNALSRKFISIPNAYVQESLSGLPSGLDGELMVFNNEGKPATFSETQSAIMSRDGQPNFRYCIFDYYVKGLSYIQRIEALKNLNISNSFCNLVLPVKISNLDQLLEFEGSCLKSGFEGIMLRRESGQYKFGRSTLSEQILLKYKRFKDSEATIIGFKERMHNANKAGSDNFGYTKRSLSKYGLEPTGTLGALIVKDENFTSGPFEIGVFDGLKSEDLKNIWDKKQEFLGKIVTYTFQEVGVKNLPRFPVFKGFRNEQDI